jgi:hypothetical protein
MPGQESLRSKDLRKLSISSRVLDRLSLAPDLDPTCFFNSIEAVRLSLRVVTHQTIIAFPRAAIKKPIRKPINNVPQTKRI